MKLTGQNVPPALLAEYKKLVATKPANLAGVSQARTTKRAHAPAPTRPTKKEFKDYENAVDFLIAYLTTRDGHPPAAGFRAEQINNIKIGYFDPAYWAQCAQDSADVFTNAPVSGAWVGARAYAYPDPANLPSVPTYGAGTPSTGNLDYIGATIAGTFKDLQLKWKRYVFTLANSFAIASDEPVFLKLTGSVAATANVRASRAMLSAIIKRWICLPGSTRLTTTEAPTIKPIQAFWRYRTPRGASPYYAYTNTLRLVYSMRSQAQNSILNGGAYKYEEAPGDMTKCVVLVAPMPMMGKRFNNNTSVAVTLAATLELWQIKKGAPGFWSNAHLYHLDGTSETITYPVWSWFVFHDSTHGLMEQINPATMLREYFMLDGKLNKTRYIAPWESLPGWEPDGYVMNYYPSATGFLVAVQNNISGASDFFYLNTDGTIFSQGDGNTHPAMWGIIWQNQGIISYNPATNLYMQNALPLYGLQEMYGFDTSGNLVTFYDYSAIGAWGSGDCFCSDTIAYAVVSTIAGGVRTVELWNMTAQPIFIVASFTVGNTGLPSVGYYAGVFYFLGNNAAGAYKSCTEGGVVASLANPGTHTPLGLLPAGFPYITN